MNITITDGTAPIATVTATTGGVTSLNGATGAVTITAATLGITSGTATLAAGTATVTTTAVTANTVIQLTSQVDGGTPGWLRISARTAGVSFTITSSSTSDTSTVAWLAYEPA